MAMLDEIADNYLRNIPAGQRAAFKEHIYAVARYLGTKPAYMLAVMYNESGLNPRASNPINGAAGLIQITPGTASGLGITTEYLRGLSALDQLYYVQRYYAPARGDLDGISDLYLYNFYPAAVGKPNSYIIGSEKGGAYASKVAQHNKIFDLDKDGLITVGEFRRYVKKRFPQLYKIERRSKLFRKFLWIALILLIVLLVVLGFIYRDRLF